MVYTTGFIRKFENMGKTRTSNERQEACESVKDREGYIRWKDKDRKDKDRKAAVDSG